MIMPMRIVSQEIFYGEGCVTRPCPSITATQASTLCSSKQTKHHFEKDQKKTNKALLELCFGSINYSLLNWSRVMPVQMSFGMETTACQYNQEHSQTIFSSSNWYDSLFEKHFQLLLSHDLWTKGTLVLGKKVNIRVVLLEIDPQEAKMVPAGPSFISRWKLRYSQLDSSQIVPISELQTAHKTQKTWPVQSLESLWTSVIHSLRFT